MDELINRQAAIDAVRMVIGDNRSISVCDAIKQLPPIQPANSSEIPNSSDMISRQQAINALSTITMYKGSIPFDTAVMRIEQLPSAQPEIIRCKDCKYWVPGYITDNDDFIPPKCGEWRQMVGHSSDDYCSLAERREVQDENDKTTNNTTNA